ncbi:MAG TPA: 4Fe-4S dicluster domain-containing protein [Oscillospiraceae bacterium]|nr:4Fe-4S dicluster domain-containing protein [Oscillospiraceae bacterium]
MLNSLLIDTSKCIGCRACQVACKQWNRLPAEETSFTGFYENPVRFTANSWTRVSFREHEDESTGDVSWYFAKIGCMHCTDAACEKVCPAGAISHTETGAVVTDPKKCIGCNYCVASCTFKVMSFNQKENISQKCTLCSDRQAIGLIPACAKACPTGAIQFGTRAEMVDLAHRRVNDLVVQGSSKAQIYGLEELNGTGVMYVLKDDPEEYGLPANPKIPISAYIWNAIFRPLRIFVVALVGLLLWENKRETEKVLPTENEAK